ncbi:hypothetical protein CP533_5953 [Ophiocordyceps camponoti-saundersi (nom. inval.)]|nr:hypothetical protein CP533_5953 [Ophiocordyceps camponoti-saundersi (nom. inval.)]
MYNNSLPLMLYIIAIFLLLWQDTALAAPIPDPGQVHGSPIQRGGNSAPTSTRIHRTGRERSFEGEFRAVGVIVGAMPPSRSALQSAYQRLSQPGSSNRAQSKKMTASPLDEGAGKAPPTVGGKPSKARKTDKGSWASRSGSRAPRFDIAGKVLGKKDLPRNPNGMSDEDVSLWSDWLENPKSAPDLPSLTAGAPPAGNRNMGTKSRTF